MQGVGQDGKQNLLIREFSDAEEPILILPFRDATDTQIHFP
jgi:hypothetical protein